MRKSLAHPHSMGNILAFGGFLFVAYSSFSYFNYKPSGDVLATCTSEGAYGETCVEDESYDIEKWVRIKGASEASWKDKVTNVKESDTVEFRLRAENTGDVETDDAETEDTLPSEMTKTGGAGLTESWADFGPDDVKEFIIEAKLKASEFSSTVKFEKCVVNKVELTIEGDFKGSDTATVCYNNADVELPETGPLAALPLGLTGIAMAAVGGWLKRRTA
jgi:hypothetical protein